MSLRAREEHDDGRDDAEELDRGEEDRRELLGVDVRDPVRLVQVAELALEGALAVERLDDRHPRDRLGELRRDGRDPRADVGERDVGGGLEPAGDDDARRQHDERDDAQAPVEQEEPADRGEERQRVDDERRQSLVEHVREGVDVARQPGDDPARLLLGEVAERQRREVVEEVAAQVEHDLLADPGQHQPRRRAEDPGRQPDRDVEHDVEREPRRVGGLDAVVDRVADDRPAEHGRGGGDRGDEHDEADPPAAADGVAPEARQAGALLSGGKGFVSEQVGEGAAEADQVLRQAALDDAAVPEDDRAVGDEDRREPLAGDQHGAPRDGGTEGRDEVALRLRVDRGHRVVQHDHAGLAR